MIPSDIPMLSISRSPRSAKSQRRPCIQAFLDRLDAIHNALCAKEEPMERKVNNPLNNRDSKILKKILNSRNLRFTVKLISSPLKNILCEQ